MPPSWQRWDVNMPIKKRIAMKDQSKIEAIIADQKRILVRNRQSLFQYARQAVEKDNPAAESIMADLLEVNVRARNRIEMLRDLQGK
nr:MAG TPA: hypothetical protein [Caudoviricetes sp.]